jgi:hypothetical protein
MPNAIKCARDDAERLTREKNGNPMGDGESFNLVIAPAKEKGQDLLFIGGDFNNQAFAAFERAK